MLLPSGSMLSRNANCLLSKRRYLTIFLELSPPSITGCPCSSRLLLLMTRDSPCGERSPVSTVIDGGESGVPRSAIVKGMAVSTRLASRRSRIDVSFYSILHGVNNKQCAHPSVKRLNVLETLVRRRSSNLIVKTFEI